MLRTVKYWHRSNATTWEPLATNRAGLKIECKAKGLMWCMGCQAAVKPEEEPGSDGLENICPLCGDYVYPPK